MRLLEHDCILLSQFRITFAPRCFRLCPAPNFLPIFLVWRFTFHHNNGHSFFIRPTFVHLFIHSSHHLLAYSAYLRIWNAFFLFFFVRRVIDRVFIHLLRYLFTPLSLSLDSRLHFSRVESVGTVILPYTKIRWSTAFRFVDIAFRATLSPCCLCVYVCVCCVDAFYFTSLFLFTHSLLFSISYSFFLFLLPSFFVFFLYSSIYLPFCCLSTLTINELIVIPTLPCFYLFVSSPSSSFPLGSFPHFLFLFFYFPIFLRNIFIFRITYPGTFVCRPSLIFFDVLLLCTFESIGPPWSYMMAHLSIWLVSDSSNTL